MIRKIIAIALIFACLSGLAVGCGEVASDITASVLEAARAELEAQVKAKIEEYKVTVVETKTAVGDINDSDAEYQFFFALLIQTDAEDSAAGCAAAVGKLFGEAGYMAQKDNFVSSEHLTKQFLTYKNSDYTAGNYYTVYVYVEDITKVVDMEAIKDKVASLGK